jgi:hypothetical protein
MLPVELSTLNVDPASTTKSSPDSPFTVRVLVPEVGLTIFTFTLLVKIICAKDMLEDASMVAGPVAGVAPPKLVPSKIKISVVPVDDGRDAPEPFKAVFQLAPVFIPVAAAVPPTQ